ncbi:MAG TPA: hypothetical protein VI758_05020 [Bacteroidota bacterium]
MRTTFILVLAAVGLMLVSGCTGYGNYMVSTDNVTATNAKDIRVYSLTEPTGNYQVLGYISVYNSDAQDAGNDLKEKLKARAALIGANAIIAFKLNQAVSGGGGAEGIAIRFK